VAGVHGAFAELEPILAARDRNRLFLFFINDLNDLTSPFFDLVRSSQQRSTAASKEELYLAEVNTQRFLVVNGFSTVAGIALIGILGIFVYRFISTRVRRIGDTVQKVSQGDYQARTSIASRDELGVLAQAFDKLLEERVAALAQSERENDALNESVINLLQAVSRLSQRDLTVAVPVSEDVTGTVADALNLLTGEMAKVLQNVTEISRNVAQASSRVKSQADTAMGVARAERSLVLQTSEELTRTADAMGEIASLARRSSEAAERAMKTTEVALEAVTSTVSGINSTRDTIRETEKRIKRLGERSQEISTVVNLINNIAERTHILALNASMHAASAGEAGRGFAVVANEVQRLAENAREATSEIAKLVHNIQVETTDTVTTMNAAIRQVVEGSRLAEQAGERMKLTQHSTAELVAAVQNIAVQSQTQASASTQLKDRASQIELSTEQTNLELQQQTQQTEHLLSYAQGLVEAVQVFRLPAHEQTGEQPMLKVANA
jgi:twitching motility protein PilJ